MTSVSLEQVAFLTLYVGSIAIGYLIKIAYRFRTKGRQDGHDARDMEMSRSYNRMKRVNSSFKCFGFVGIVALVVVPTPAVSALIAIFVVSLLLWGTSE